MAATKANCFPFWADSEAAGVHVKGCESGRFATGSCDRVDGRCRQFVVRLVVAIRSEIDCRTVFGPGDIVFCKPSGRELSGNNFLIRIARAQLSPRCDPDVRNPGNPDHSRGTRRA